MKNTYQIVVHSNVWGPTVTVQLIRRVREEDGTFHSSRDIESICVQPPNWFQSLLKITWTQKVERAINKLKSRQQDEEEEDKQAEAKLMPEHTKYQEAERIASQFQTNLIKED